MASAPQDAIQKIPTAVLGGMAAVKVEPLAAWCTAR